jgi:hypothetical protein
VSILSLLTDSDSLLLLLVLIMEALLPEENQLEALVQASPLDCVESVFHCCLVCFPWVQVFL